MNKGIPREMVHQFQEYREAAEASAEDLAFTMDHLDDPIPVDYSLESLRGLDAMILNFHRCGHFPEELFPFNDFIDLASQYAAMCVVHHTGAEWTQAGKKDGFMPCIDGFGNAPSDRIFPPRTADLQRTRLARGDKAPVFAPILAEALKIHGQKKG